MKAVVNKARLAETQFYPNGAGCTVTLRPRAQKSFAKKYKHDSRVTSAFSELLKSLQKGEEPHPKFNVHRLSKQKFENTFDWWDAHLKGQSILIRFRVDPVEHQIIIGAMGTHDDVLTEDTASAGFDFTLPADSAWA